MLVLVGCGDGDDTGSADPTSGETATTAAPTEPDDGGGEAASGTFTVQGDVYNVTESVSCDTDGLTLDILAHDYGDDRNITLLIEIDDAGEWSARIHGRTVEDNYGTMTIHEEVSGDYELSGDTLTGEFVLDAATADEPVTVSFNLTIPAEFTDPCPAH